MTFKPDSVLQESAAHEEHVDPTYHVRPHAILYRLAPSLMMLGPAHEAAAWAQPHVIFPWIWPTW